MQEQPQFSQPDGTSQADRIQKALDPGYVSVDERSIKDLLAFARKYSEELRFFNERNEADGDWARFLGDNDLDEIVAYLNDPKQFQDDLNKREQFRRPHLVLFLTFLELLQYARTQLNDLTRKHLEFYYQEALRMTSRKGTPDQVHVLVELADGQDQFLLQAESPFQAGQDSQGNALFYCSDEKLVANQASVESLKTVFAEKMTIGIREARQTPDLLAELFPGNKNLVAEEVSNDGPFIAMLVMALGTPGPGGPLAPYPTGRSIKPAIRLTKRNSHPIDPILLGELDEMLKFIPSNLYMPLSSLRSLMQLKQEQEQSGPQWIKVNDILEKAGRKRDTNFTLNRTDPDNFEKNLLAALDRKAFGDFFNELPDVDDIYDLYRRCDRDDVQDFIKISLHMPVEDFTTMMDLVEEINGRWRQIYEILRIAARRKDPDRKLLPPRIRPHDDDKFIDLVKRTLGAITYPPLDDIHIRSLDDCYREVIKLEQYFHVTAEEFVFIRAINEKQKEARSWEWDQVYAILDDAYAEKTLEKVLPERRNVLKTKMETEGFNAMILFALGDPKPGDKLPDKRDFDKLLPVQDRDYISENLFLEPANFLYIKNTEAKGKEATEEEWANIYAILEQAQRRKRGWQEPRAEVEKWDNLYFAEDATQIKMQPGAQGQPVTPCWRTFGQGHSTEEGVHTKPGSLGFAIASPLLALAEGKRTITLTLVFQEESFDEESVSLAIPKKTKDPSPFLFQLSTAKEMVAIENTRMQLIHTRPSGVEKSQPALQFTLTLDEQTPPVTALTAAPLIQTPWPVLQILLADILDETDPVEGTLKRYRAFQSLTLEKVKLSVVVDGMTTLTLQNDDALLNPKKPFEPFGMSPVVGSSFYFAHPELCSKRLEGLTLNIDWLGVDDDLNSYYRGYKYYPTPTSDPETKAADNTYSDSPITDNAGFKASLKLHDNRSFYPIKDIQLFNAATPPNKGATQTNQVPIDLTTGYPHYQRDIHPVIAPEVLDWRRYWQVELLAPDFQHGIYPQAAAGCAKKQASATDSTFKPYIINRPYTPKIKRLSVGYKASLEIDLTTSDLNSQVDRLYHIEPFGYLDLAGYGSKPYPFLPQFENEGELYIGIKNLAPPQDLSLLFQMAEGSADPDAPREKVEWNFLDGNGWHSLEEGRLLSDTTNGLLNSGIIKFSLPPVQSSTLLPADLYWLQTTIAKNSRSVADTVTIKTQAVRATFVDHNNAPDHLAQPLPANSITGLAEPQPKVKAIHQPYSSFGGKSPEQAGSFYTRASERLRHKNRALTCWDYEHMVLEAFPGIFKVKCLPVGVSDDPRLADTIQVIVIPDIRGKLPFEPFEPKLPADMLLQIEQYLTRHCAPFARFQVKNPTYVHLRVRLDVRLRQDANPGYYQSLLNEELQRYLTPWAYDPSAEIVFGGEINTGLIINFVEERPYVDYVAGIKLFISLDDGQLPTPYDGSILAPDAILVSDRSHVIGPITEEIYDEEYFTGINYMKIELDFQIATG